MFADESKLDRELLICSAPVHAVQLLAGGLQYYHLQFMPGTLKSDWIASH